MKVTDDRETLVAENTSWVTFVFPWTSVYVSGLSIFRVEMQGPGINDMSYAFPMRRR